MKVIFSGKGGRPGTWRMRAEDIAAIRPDWKAIPNATEEDFKGADAVILIKRTNPTLIAPIQQWGGPFIYDALDFWRQPLEDKYIKSPTGIERVFKDHFQRVSAHLVLCVNNLMAKDLAKLGLNTETLYHHYDSQLTHDILKIPDSILYWGRRQYLTQDWYQHMRKTCAYLGKQFLIHDGEKSLIGKDAYGAEVMFAIRGGSYGTWLAKRWKSGIKGITAERMGIPYVAMPEQSYLEQASKNLFKFTDKNDVAEAILKAFEHKDDPEIKKPSTTYCLEKCVAKLDKIVEKAASIHV